MQEATECVKEEEESRDSPFLEVNCYIWEKDSHGLYDYESRRYATRRFRISGSCKLYYSHLSSEVRFDTCDRKRPPAPDFTHIFSLAVEEMPGGRAFYAEPAAEPAPGPARPFLVVRSLKDGWGGQKGYLLEVGDVIKLGRMEFVVVEFKDGGKTYSEGREMQAKGGILLANKREGAEGSCKICFEGQSEGDFLIRPCLCKGTCSFIHLGCLRKWIENKISKQLNEHSVVYNFAKFECEICHHPYPYFVTVNRKTFTMLTIDRPKRPYLILQSCSDADDRDKLLFVVKVPESNCIRLGRAQNCEVRITDISVSRSHAHIQYEAGRFRLFDDNSKFGTLVRVRNGFVLGFELVAFQTGRSVTTFSLCRQAAEQ